MEYSHPILAKCGAMAIWDLVHLLVSSLDSTLLVHFCLKQWLLPPAQQKPLLKTWNKDCTTNNAGHWLLCSQCLDREYQVSPAGPSGLELAWISESFGNGDFKEEGIKCFLEPQVCNRLWLLLASPWQGPAPIHPTQPPHTRGKPSVHTTMHGMNTWFASSAPCMASSPCISYGWLYRSTVCWVLALSL